MEEFTDQCPYCGEIISLLIDTSAGDQHYIEDCAVCCRPIQVRVTVEMDGSWQVQLNHENEV
ncbi:CPXCG motif-containing cysteine-rich protein [Microbulbifer agarilyticus]|uniref:CPXCG motif-containing cysteine-rich protein n=1 Tax=Microbulbifer agarilyticus TaxID=260552 RepID=UPI001CD5EBCB|nr:CPXCG motif-containing cysteine-rich protein [Microbulbifer agarilyticus]MCA0893123.1 CPXCG motif-containing cysteine-rich protein [Microbulbifer agarilyticus]